MSTIMAVLIAVVVTAVVVSGAGYAFHYFRQREARGAHSRYDPNYTVDALVASVRPETAESEHREFMAEHQPEADDADITDTDPRLISGRGPRLLCGQYGGQPEPRWPTEWPTESIA